MGNRKQALFGAVEQLRGERDSDLAPFRGRHWDAAVDTCGYLPRVVRASVEVLRDSVPSYLFVSSISVYADMATAGQDESAPRAQLPSPENEDIPAHYGALKAACEDVVLAAYGEKAIVVRPGLIVGPFDPTGRFTYWPQRVARGGRVLAPADPSYPVQFIDARDLAAWMLDLVERRTGGTFNASGPAEPMDFRGFLTACRDALGSNVEFVWPDAEFLARYKVQAWTHLPLYAGDEGRGLCAARLDRALAAGLRLRPVGATCVDTAQWAAKTALPDGIGLSAEREAELLRSWQARAAS